MSSSHLILRRPLLLLPSIFQSIRVFSIESTLRMRWPKSFSFSITPSKEISGLISFRMDRLDLLAVQGTLKSLLQHHSSKALCWLENTICHNKYILAYIMVQTEQTFIYIFLILRPYWDDPEGWNGQGGGRGVQDGEHIYTQG